MVSRNLYERPDGRVRHSTVVARSGSGKTEFLLSKIAQQVRRGGGCLIKDAKPSKETIDAIASICWAYGVYSKLRIINLDDATQSHTYNPLLRGDAEQKTEQIANILGSGKDVNDHFKSMFVNAVLPTIACIERMGKAFHVWDLFILLTNPDAMEWLARNTPQSEERTNYEAFLQSYRTPDGKGNFPLDVRRLQQQVNGGANRLQPYGSGNLGRIMKTYSPQVDLLQAFDQGLIVYVALPTSDRGESAINFAKLMLADERNAVNTIYQRGRNSRPYVVFEDYNDEFGSYAIERSEELPEKMRGAGIGGMFLFQTSSNLKAISEEFLHKITGNAEFTYVGPVGDAQTAEWAATHIGDKLQQVFSYSRGTSSGTSNKSVDPTLFAGESKGSSRGTSVSEKHDFAVRPEELMNGLKVGQYWVMPRASEHAFKIQSPMVVPPETISYQHIEYETKNRLGINADNLFNRDLRLGVV